MVKVVASFLIIALLISWGIITFVGLEKEERKRFFKQLGFGFLVVILTLFVFLGLTILF